MLRTLTEGNEMTKRYEFEAGKRYGCWNSDSSNLIEKRTRRYAWIGDLKKRIRVTYIDGDTVEYIPFDTPYGMKCIYACCETSR